MILPPYYSLEVALTSWKRHIFAEVTAVRKRKSKVLFVPTSSITAVKKRRKRSQPLMIIEVMAQ
jgi:hypothetical protein